MVVIALLTDFGTRDPYVAAMKGVIASRCGARVADLTHEIAPFDVFGAAFFLRDAAPYWPAETIFGVVVDPGVGTARRLPASRPPGTARRSRSSGRRSTTSAASTTRRRCTARRRSTARSSASTASAIS